ncbi:Peptide chain release factor 2 [Alteracholeplasma palmae J233]|uniref:Peptide chain release factor 2 n=1 Tax=Alteracholeplasma palmae (strain ATCC 49389 / J233) TaxID=1318466 RepID=U4KRC5_ALTPJ|nr:peptide chain release factor 2 [Alteracholeplasma palmae]CCV64041.1 Peptide chain release factor 2 [Alteracholeplasma palmae J233]
MERYEINKTLEQFEKSIIDLEKAINVSEKNIELEALNKKMQEPNFWNDSKEAKKTTQAANNIAEQLKTYQEIKKDYDNIVDWFELSEEQTEEWTILEKDIVKLSKAIKNFEIEVLLSDTYDFNNAILVLHPGAGGTESQDWCEMLFRMYQRYAQKKKFKVEILDYQAGEEAGVKSVTMLIKGPFAYGYLKAERGVHRLVRISPFDSNARRHTSFVSCDIMPEIDETVDIDIKDEDIKVDVYRSSGAGGQSVNTTDSAVRITHIPTGIVVTCQNERSQIKNKETALSILKSKLVQEEIKRKEEELRSIKGEQKDIGWGSQIRSYVFHPYQMVKDHRTNFEVAQIEQVMDGEIEGFINEYLKKSE